MGRTTSISRDQLRSLGRLSKLAALRGFYLAGGTGIAAHLGHRRSLDLDLFSQSPSVDLDGPRIAVLGAEPGASVVSISDATVQVRGRDGPIDLVRYPYPPLASPTPGPGGFPVAGLLDLSTMKLSAIARRGLRRDFWDLYAISTQGGILLPDAAAAYVKRFGVAESDLYAVLRSLTYFADAEADSIWPVGLTPRAWATIRAFFEAEAPRLLCPST